MKKDLSGLLDNYTDLRDAIRRVEEICKEKTKALCVRFEKETGVCLTYPEMVQVQVAIDFDSTREKRRMSETCNECGKSVSQSSGNFVNRVPDCNTVEERKEMGKPYPIGNFICAECDNKCHTKRMI